MNTVVSSNLSVRRTIQTSYCQLFKSPINGKTIKQIEIPLIQRDYAQGRRGESVSRIRERFLNVLCNALKSDTLPVDLDFVYGDVNERQALLPLDGQQRLTTLFLLHWYVAQRSDVDLSQELWTRFSYDTRPGARQFCEFLVATQPAWQCIQGDHLLSAWLQDQKGYFITWKHDPTIQSMLVMLDAIHHSCEKKALDYPTAWQRLSDPDAPAIRFHLLPMTDNGLTDSLYIKMNSRGKPLTEFENFKADFEGMLKRVHPQYADIFARKVDNDWTDLLWEYKGDDNLIDDEFMCYFRFVTEVYAWKNGEFSTNVPIEELAEQLYGGTNPAPIDYLCKAFDVWRNPVGPQTGFVKNIFQSLFTLNSSVSPDDALLLFSTPGNENSTDLFNACCRNYGRGPKLWTYGNTLLLYAVLISQIALRFEGAQIDQFELRKRLCIVRNLIEASTFELALRESDAKTRIQNLLTDVDKIMLKGHVDNLSSLSFNRAQIHDEIRKKAFLDQHPNLALILFALEDHPLLQGGLTVFPLDFNLFVDRALTFQTLFDKAHWPSLTGALLCKGDYGRHWKRGDGAYIAFGSEKNLQPWQDLFRGRHNEKQHPATDALMALLDDVQKRQCDVLTALDAIQNEYCQNPATPKDWRYYFVKYPLMRNAPQGAYVFGNSYYRACRLEGKYVYSFQDPYLNALISTADKEKAAACLGGSRPWFYGLQDENGQRHIQLKVTGISLECIEAGWAVGIPGDLRENLSTEIDNLLSRHNIGTDNLLRTITTVGSTIDQVDRIAQGANLLKELIDLDCRYHNAPKEHNDAQP
jgi:hypothetical protein